MYSQRHHQLILERTVHTTDSQTVLMMRLAVVYILSYLIMYDEFQVGREHGREGMSMSLLALTELAVAVGSD